jgi:hypothetical protein
MNGSAPAAKSTDVDRIMGCVTSIENIVSDITIKTYNIISPDVPTAEKGKGIGASSFSSDLYHRLSEIQQDLANIYTHLARFI